MKHSLLFNRQRTHAHITLAILLVMSSWPQNTSAASTDSVFTLRPMCDVGEWDNNTVFGPIPSTMDEQVTPGPGRCYSYEVADPKTLQTPILKVGDILDMDVVIENPSRQKIQRARAWLSYDPDILEGISIDISEKFPDVTPGESNFSVSQGYAMIEASSKEGSEPNNNPTALANVKFRVISAPNGGTFVSFYDVSSGGHTDATTKGAANEESIIGQEPGSLHVRFGGGSGQIEEEETKTPVGGACEENTECQSNLCVNGVCTQNQNTPNGGECSANGQCESKLCSSGICTGNPNGSACITNGQCASNLCASGICTEKNQNLPNGSACTTSTQCQSQLCVDGACMEKYTKIPNGSPCSSNEQCESNQCVENECVGNSVSNPTNADERTAFSLLQVRNVQAATEGSSAYVRWDPLQSSQLHAYNIYYGTTTGRYIQRKTVEGTADSLTIRSLPVGTTYYFAVRAVSINGEESAFSQEVSITIGDPNSSTSPVVGGTNPVTGSVSEEGEGEVPGETGASTTLALLAIISAVIGTFFASRRQLIVHTQQN